MAETYRQYPAVMLRCKTLACRAEYAVSLRARSRKELIKLLINHQNTEVCPACAGILKPENLAEAKIKSENPRQFRPRTQKPAVTYIDDDGKETSYQFKELHADRALREESASNYALAPCDDKKYIYDLMHRYHG